MGCGESAQGHGPLGLKIAPAGSWDDSDHVLQPTQRGLPGWGPEQLDTRDLPSCFILSRRVL